jgi:hypothetical protein
MALAHGAVSLARADDEGVPLANNFRRIVE